MQNTNYSTKTPAGGTMDYEAMLATQAPLNVFDELMDYVAAINSDFARQLFATQSEPQGEDCGNEDLVGTVNVNFAQEVLEGVG